MDEDSQDSQEKTVQNDRAEATKSKINDMRQRLESMRKRKLEEAAEDVKLIGEQLDMNDSSPTKKSRPDVEEEPTPTLDTPQSPDAGDIIEIDSGHVQGPSMRPSPEEVDLTGENAPSRAVSMGSNESGAVHSPGYQNPLVKIVFSDASIAR
jgi:hypothetical protein